MFRKLVLSTVPVAGLLAPLAGAPAAQANGVLRHFRFEVLYRDPCNPVWVLAGHYRNMHEARRVADSYNCRGFAVTIR